MKDMKKQKIPLPVPIGSAGASPFASLYDSRMRWPIRRARLQVVVREAFQAKVGLPLEEALMTLWEQGLPGGRAVERQGLPRRVVERRLGDALIVHVDPRKLIRSTDWRGFPYRQRPSSSAFIWDGDWDQWRGDLRYGSRYRFISDIDDHRDDLRRTERFRSLYQWLEVGRPWSSHHQGVLLDSEERILAYLRVYLSFLDDMTERGFDTTQGKDDLGVAITREGRMLKINRGLHRLAMAQRIGLPSVPVRVKAVHRQWWQRVSEGESGEAALERIKMALVHCSPEGEPGARDPATTPEDFDWPVPRLPTSLSREEEE
ncbi:hypothetical protein GCM10007160_41800 [Litchfieldella qijiaojingensis]|uniref:ParB/Sulfiredoxin domain-containing protein n=1 Tax=Litchfieldella qijiaojingensis TaxID=980347 RepID=A0ABQ2ZAD8_9GAMM|nr:hypothetical protein [Halomonas qijiaojingensis]GGY10237.1 hypothetical protein GCM10007160_41800 [Halomonas qijiaojingensis]